MATALHPRRSVLGHMTVERMCLPYVRFGEATNIAATAWMGAKQQ